MTTYLYGVGSGLHRLAIRLSGGERNFPKIVAAAITLVRIQNNTNLLATDRAVLLHPTFDCFLVRHSVDTIEDVLWQKI